MTVVVGVDPGSRWCAMTAARFGPDSRDGAYLAHAVLDREAVHLDAPLDEWSGAVIDSLEGLTAGLFVGLVAVELTTAPRGHARGREGHIIAPGPLIDTAQIGGAVFGACLGTGCPAVYVTPDRHGTVDLPKNPTKRFARALLEHHYPAELIGPRETTGTGKSPWQHARAALDIARAGALHLRRSRT